MNNWAWANNAHLPTKNVQELRKLIEAGAAEETANGSDPRVTLQLEVTLELSTQRGIRLENTRQNGIRIGPHGAELDAAETLIAPTHPTLDVKHRAWRTELHQPRQKQQHR